MNVRKSLWGREDAHRWESKQAVLYAYGIFKEQIYLIKRFNWKYVYFGKFCWDRYAMQPEQIFNSTKRGVLYNSCFYPVGKHFSAWTQQRGCTLPAKETAAGKPFLLLRCPKTISSPDGIGLVCCVTQKTSMETVESEWGRKWRKRRERIKRSKKIKGEGPRRNSWVVKLPGVVHLRDQGWMQVAK